MISVENFVKQYTIEQIKFLEENKDLQFLSIKDAFFYTPFEYQKDFVFFIIQNSLICYQLSWSWENYWQEACNWWIKEFESFKKNNIKFWKRFLEISKYNKRFYNIKLTRIQKSLNIKNILYGNEFWFYENMNKLAYILAKHMKQNITDKTIVFSVKMFWYVSRIFTNKFIPFPVKCVIPVDSRITKIYKKNNPNKKPSKKNIISYFNNLSKQTNIPPLHIDSLLWLKYYKLVFENNKTYS